jgi:hypothetical protein
MFDFSNDEEEDKRIPWYSPIGEFVVLFSNVEFATKEWVRLLLRRPLEFDITNPHLIL